MTQPGKCKFIVWRLGRVNIAVRTESVFHHALQQSHAFRRKSCVGDVRLNRLRSGAPVSNSVSPHCIQGGVGTPQDHQQILLSNRPIRRMDQSPPSPNRFLYFCFAFLTDDEGVNQTVYLALDCLIGNGNSCGIGFLNRLVQKSCNPRTKPVGYVLARFSRLCTKLNYYEWKKSVWDMDSGRDGSRAFTLLLLRPKDEGDGHHRTRSACVSKTLPTHSPRSRQVTMLRSQGCARHE